MSKYSIGIDLGTTNCVVSYAALGAENAELSRLEIPQVTAPTESEARESMPSFLYVPTADELEKAIYELPEFPSYPTVQGIFASRQSADQPQRTIAAAKSWLCHGGVDRHSPILPWQAPDEVIKFSPVNATKLLLRQIVDAWEHAFPDAPFQDQLITLTVPASFDMSARELTREAAAGAGFPEEFILLEEPQAALYNWLYRRGDAWRESVNEGDILLICDVGGGTSDFSLLAVEQEDGDLSLVRKAVGNHLLVGGDNMDLALAHLVAQKFAAKGHKLNPWQSVSLWHACRRAKESLLAPDGKEKETISVLGRGSKLVGGTISVEVDRQEVQSLLVDGFLPACKLEDRPAQQMEAGFQEVGLPYESDSAISKHLAAFLQANLEGEAKQLHLLPNGGVFKSPVLQQRIVQIVAGWFGNEPTNLLDASEDLDSAVATGAAYYGWAKDRGGIRIRAGTARSYYVGIETAGLAVPGMPRPLQAVCVVPFGMEEGSEVDVPGREVGLVVGREAQFRFFAASDRKDDEPGTTLSHWDEDELTETSPMQVVLDAEEVPEEGFVPVRFSSRVSELGVFELWCKSTRDQRQWKLEFTIRDHAEEDAPSEEQV